MIFILSSKDDNSTLDVMEWLFYENRKIKVLRYNDEMRISNFALSINNKSSFIKYSENKLIIQNEENSYWYRRGHFETDYEVNQNMNFVDNDILTNSISTHVRTESLLLRNSIERFLSNRNNNINFSKQNFTNKIENLILATENGINVPDTIITDNFTDLFSFVNLHTKIVLKSFHFPTIKVSTRKKRIHIFGDNQVLALKDIKKIAANNSNANFTPSMFQNYVDKKYEIRSFYLNGTFKSMAIFSQENEKTKYDFRNYDNERPNRCIPYKLPRAFENQIKKYLFKMNLNCGSIDILVTPDNKYVFLEINPIGQFQWLSKNCNYFIERLLANTLNKQK